MKYLHVDQVPSLQIHVVEDTTDTPLVPLNARPKRKCMLPTRRTPNSGAFTIASKELFDRSVN